MNYEDLNFLSQPLELMHSCGNGFLVHRKLINAIVRSSMNGY